MQEVEEGLVRDFFLFVASKLLTSDGTALPDLRAIMFQFEAVAKDSAFVVALWFGLGLSLV